MLAVYAVYADPVYIPPVQPISILKATAFQTGRKVVHAAKCETLTCVYPGYNVTSVEAKIIKICSKMTYIV